MWEITSSLADRLFAFSNVILVAGAAAVFIGTMGSILMSGVREQFSNERISANERATAAAVAESDIAKKGAAEANARAAEAQLKLEELRRLAGPRRIDRQAFSKELQGKPKSPIQIWYLSDLSDGFWLATDLMGALVEASWEIVGPPIPMPESAPDPSDLRAKFVPRTMVAGAQPSGVTVVSHGTPSSIDAPPNPSQQALMRALALGLGTGAAGGYSQTVPDGVLRVIIAAKQDPIFPATQEPDAARNQK